MGAPRLRLRPALAAAALAAGLVVPVGLAAPAVATPCPPIIPCILPPAATTGPTIEGTAKVGEVVTATEPAWDQDGVTTTYQWLRGGTDIEGATGETYTLTGADLEQMISVRAGGTNALGIPGSGGESPAVEPVKGDAVQASAPPQVSGSPAVGGTLTSTSGTWPGEPEPAFAYQWFRSRASGTGAERIDGATAASYSPVAGDSGRALVVLVTADRFGYEKGVAVSNAVRVPQAAGSVTLGLLKRTVKRSVAPRVRVVLGSSIGVVPTGTVTIFDGTRKVRSITLARDAGGTVVFQVPRQSLGRHRLTARWAGDTAHRPAVSGVQVLTVVR